MLLLGIRTADIIHDILISSNEACSSFTRETAQVISYIMLVSRFLPWPAASLPCNKNTVYLIIRTSMNINKLISVQISEGLD